jgi:hypothetical protein
LDLEHLHPEELGCDAQVQYLGRLAAMVYRLAYFQDLENEVATGYLTCDQACQLANTVGVGQEVQQFGSLQDFD